jgi:hypothetical protein
VNHETLKKRVERLEEKGPEATDVVMWSPSDGGIFGHVHVKGKKRAACSDEEEVEIMRSHFEIDKHRIGDKGEYVPFWKYLEAFTYLAPDGLAERQRTIIDRLRTC